MLLLSRPAGAGWYERLVFSPDGGRLVGATHTGQVHMWTLPGGSGSDVISGTAEGDGPIPGVSEIGFSADGRYLVLGFDAPPGLLVRDLQQGIDLTENAIYRVTGLAVAPSGNALVRYGSTQLAIGGGDLASLSWSADGVKPRWAVPDDAGINGRPRFLPDGERIVFCLLGIGLTEELVGSVALYAADSGELLREFESPNVGVNEPTVAPDGATFAVLAERSLLVWQTDGDSRPAKKVVNDNRKHFTGVAFHPSGQYLAATSNDATVKLYDTATWQVAKTFTWKVGRLRSVAFSPDGMLAAVGSDRGKIVVWDVDL